MVPVAIRSCVQMLKHATSIVTSARSTTGGPRGTPGGGGWWLCDGRADDRRGMSHARSGRDECRDGSETTLHSVIRPMAGHRGTVVSARRETQCPRPRRDHRHGSRRRPTPLSPLGPRRSPLAPAPSPPPTATDVTRGVSTLSSVETSDAAQRRGHPVRRLGPHPAVATSDH